MYNIIGKTYSIMLLMAILICTAGCEDWCKPKEDDCIVNEEERKVLLLYSAGYNSLRGYLLDDIKDLKHGWLPGNGCNEDIILVYTHTPERNAQYNNPTTPYLIRLYQGKNGAPIADTIKTYSSSTTSSTAAQLSTVLSDVRESFPSGSYGMIFSSHGTGYLPSGYYSNPNSYIYNDPGSFRRSRTQAVPSPVPYIEPETDPSLPMTKSIGQDVVGPSGNRFSYEIEIQDFAKAIPMHLDYILFDACLMGGIEVAYELRDKCSLLGFSQAEVLAEGLDYNTLATHLIQKESPDVLSVCNDYFIQYDRQSGVHRSATISLVDCSKLEPVAEVCRELFPKYRDVIRTMDYRKVQRYYRDNKHWFYDLESIMTEAGADAEEIARLQEALDRCVLYKGYTPSFMSEFNINTFSGFSMYLPSHGSSELDRFYKTLQWNMATGLVE
jgi:hypothetical protein